MAAKINEKNREKYNYAYTLFMQGTLQKEIAERVGVAVKTIGEWKTAGQWGAKRAARSISMNELVAKTLQKIDRLLESEDFNADAFAKSVAQLKSLKASHTVDDEITAFMAFQTWLIERQAIDKAIDERFLKKLTQQQDLYIQHRMSYEL